MAGYQIKVTIEKTKPPMWRRLAIPDRITFRNLHKILQRAFGWNEMHLHDFVFQHTEISVGDEENVDVNFGEEKLLIDDFLNAGWIRYTYDFGDDWVHKIVLEKELPEYEDRYPQVLKFRRNNFEEDSGGVWCAQEQEPYDMEAVNECLRSACSYPVDPKNKSAKESKICVDGIRVQQEQFREMMKQFRELSRAFDQVTDIENGEMAPVDQRNEAISEFFEANLGAGDRWEVKYTQKEMQQFLEGDGLLHLTNLRKYLATEDETVIPTIQSLSFSIVKTLKAHPEYLLLLFSANEIKSYIKWFRTGEQEKMLGELPSEMQLVAMNMWGLAEVDVRKERKKHILSVALPQDVDSLVSSLERLDLNALDQDSERIWKRIYGLILCYGYIDLQVMHEKYKRRFGDISWNDFRRHVYLRGRFLEGIATGIRYDKDALWAAVSDEMADVVVRDQAEYKIELEYADFTKWQILEMGRNGFESVYRQWDQVEESLKILGLDSWESEYLINDLMESIMLGDGMDSLLEAVEYMLYEGEDEEKAGGLGSVFWEKLQYRLCVCWCTVGLPVLKGYSRLEVAERTGKSVFDVAADGSFRLPDFHVSPIQYGNVIEKRGFLQKSESTPKLDPVRIDPDASCPCGSGKRYRQCCGRKK